MFEYMVSSDVKIILIYIIINKSVDVSRETSMVKSIHMDIQ